MRYALEVPDTLLGLAIHFTPYYNNAGDETFLLRAWTDSSGLPGVELGENYQFHTPEYFTDGYDVFAYYAYDDPIPVEGNIHVGLVQGSEAMLNFGLDKNTKPTWSAALPTWPRRSVVQLRYRRHGDDPSCDASQSAGQLGGHRRPGCSTNSAGIPESGDEPHSAGRSPCTGPVVPV